MASAEFTTSDTSSWQMVQPRRSAKGNRQSSRASRVMSGTAARVVLPVVMRNVMASSASPVLSETSDSTELPTLLRFPLPSGSLLQGGNPASAEATLVAPTSVERHLESSSVAALHLIEAQQEFVANATRLALMLSPDQLLANSEKVHQQLINL